MSVNDDQELPWLEGEKRAIGEAVRGGMPYWGACLGVQLLAASLGARVYAGSAPEVGIMPVTLTAEALADPVFAGTCASCRRSSGTGTRSTCPTERCVSPAARRIRTRLSGPAARVRRAVPPRGVDCDGPRVGRGSGVRRVPRPGARARLLAAADRRARSPSPEMLAYGRQMFSRWLDLAQAATPGS